MHPKVFYGSITYLSNTLYAGRWHLGLFTVSKWTGAFCQSLVARALEQDSGNRGLVPVQTVVCYMTLHKSLYLFATSFVLAVLTLNSLGQGLLLTLCLVNRTPVLDGTSRSVVLQHRPTSRYSSAQGSMWLCCQSTSTWESFSAKPKTRNRLKG